MKRLICDTNIWYGLGDGTIQKPKNTKLFATWTNIIELCYSHFQLKPNINIESVKGAAKAVLDYSDCIIQVNPFTYMANQFGEESIENNHFPIKKMLKQITENGLPNDKVYSDNKEAYDSFMKLKSNFSIGLNTSKSDLRNNLLNTNQNKEIFKNSDFSQKEYHAYSVLLDIDEFLKTEHNKTILIDNLEDFQNAILQVQKKLGLYVGAKQKFIQKWVLQSQMKVEDNDYFDILNLVYVDEKSLYWTEEKRWKTIIKEAGMERYLAD